MDTRLTGKIEEMDARLTGKIDALDVRLTGQMAGLRGELSATNSRIDAMLAKMIGACVASVTTTAGLAFAAGRFAA